MALSKVEKAVVATAAMVGIVAALAFSTRQKVPLLDQLSPRQDALVSAQQSAKPGPVMVVPATALPQQALITPEGEVIPTTQITTTPSPPPVVVIAPAKPRPVSRWAAYQQAQRPQTIVPGQQVVQMYVPPTTTVRPAAQAVTRSEAMGQGQQYYIVRPGTSAAPTTSAPPSTSSAPPTTSAPGGAASSTRFGRITEG